MSDDARGAREALSQVHAQAQIEALKRFGDGPAMPWQPRAALRPAVRRVLLALGTVVTAVAVAASAWALRPAPLDVDAADTVSPAAPARVEATQDDDIVDAEPMAIRSTPSPVLPARQDVVPATLVVERDGATWRIAAANASRLDAARRLAELSGSPLLGAAGLIAGTRPLDLHWQGRDLAGAWKAVLGTELNYALQCRRDRCRAWIMATAEPGADLPLPSPALAVDSLLRADAGDVPDRPHHD